MGINSDKENTNKQSEAQVDTYWTAEQVRAISRMKIIAEETYPLAAKLIGMEPNLVPKLVELMTNPELESPIDRLVVFHDVISNTPFANIIELDSSETDPHEVGPDEIEPANGYAAVRKKLLSNLDDITLFAGPTEVRNAKKGDSQYSVAVAVMREVANILIDLEAITGEALSERRFIVRGKSNRRRRQSLSDEKIEEYRERARALAESNRIHHPTIEMRAHLDGLIRKGNKLEDIAIVVGMSVDTLQVFLNKLEIKRHRDYMQEAKRMFLDGFAHRIFQGELTMHQAIAEIKQAIGWERISQQVVSNWFRDWVVEENLEQEWDSHNAAAISDVDLDYIKELVNRGLTGKQISEEMGVSRDALYYFLRTKNLSLAKLRGNL